MYLLFELINTPLCLNQFFYTTVLVILIPTPACNKYEWTLDHPIVFNPETQYGCVADVEGNIYKTIHVDNKWWMAQNLATTLFNDGDSIPYVVSDSEWDTIDKSAYCWSENDQDLYGEIFGGLYNWHAVASEKLCPEGWHVPSDSEWSSFIEFIGGMNSAGKKLREVGLTHWTSSESKATNEFGFTAIPGGYRSESGSYWDIGSYAYWWTSTEDTVLTDWAIYWHIPYGDSTIRKKIREFRNGFSVRCVKD
jgi:uncharacterized protein (TIGR02145 family)